MTDGCVQTQSVIYTRSSLLQCVGVLFVIKLRESHLCRVASNTVRSNMVISRSGVVKFHKLLYSYLYRTSTFQFVAYLMLML